MAASVLKRISGALRMLGPNRRLADPRPNVFENLLGLAREVAAMDPRGLPALVVAILRPLQSEQILGAAERSQHGAPSPIDGQTLFMGEAGQDLFSLSEPIEVDPSGFEVDLARDMVLPTMWNRKSVASALGSIGADLMCGSWRQDSNHRVSLWLPWRMAFVENGNHSIAAGILRAEGKLKPSSVYDLTPVLRDIHCDGSTYFLSSNRRAVGKVIDPRTAAVWEIGRMMSENAR